MANDVTEAAAMLWRTIAKKGGWWSAYRLAREWTPVFSIADIEKHLVDLWKSGYVAAEFTKRDGSVYAFTVGCIPLPDEQLPAFPRRPVAPWVAGSVLPGTRGLAVT